MKRERLKAFRHFSARKALYNTQLNQREIWHGRERLDSFPREIQVGTNWTCNLKCFFCKRETADKERLAALKKDELEISPVAMERLMAVLPYAEIFTLTPLGDPLMYTGLENVLERYRAARSGNLQLTTNGIAMTDRRARQLVEAGTRRIYFSIDSADPTTYAEMRVGGTLDRATQGLQHLNEWKARLETDLPEVILAATFMRKNIEDLPGLVEYAHANQIRRISVQLMEAEEPSLEPETLAHHIPVTVKSIEAARPIAQQLGVELIFHMALRHLLTASSNERDVSHLFEEEPALDARGKTLMDKCTYPWTFIIVDTDGDVRPCCWTGQSFGNLARKSFDEIWNGKAAQLMRRNFLANVIPLPCRGKHCRVDL